MFREAYNIVQSINDDDEDRMCGKKQPQYCKVFSFQLKKRRRNI